MIRKLDLKREDEEFHRYVVRLSVPQEDMYF